MVDQGVAKARTQDSVQAFAKLTDVVDGERRIVSDPPLIVPLDELVAGEADARRSKQLAQLLRELPTHAADATAAHLLEQFRFVDLARKVVGVGSVGTRCWIVLLLGPRRADPLFLQVKEAQASVLEPTSSARALREPRRAGRRTASG